uniref:Nuclear pore complex protein Nup214 phenylalanine-glycine (FG) domain-containing protein n=1 Tax=Glossina brevipalpis TaxID=37001 RepID=A0A1A9X2A1_9MUSC
MAQNAPTSIEVQDIQFKLHSKHIAFKNTESNFKSILGLLAVASNKGLMFIGDPNYKEFKVLLLKDLADETSKNVKIRIVSLSDKPLALACNCDGSMLAISYVLNNAGFLQIFQVDSFLSPNIATLYNLPIAPQFNIFSTQLLWNPVLSNNIALILNDGSVDMFTLNSGGQYDKLTLSKEHQVTSGCWSPKGKQIVFGFPEGKLQQFKPNLTPARVINCPPGLHPAPFEIIAVHWLSTFQFAAVFLQNGEDMSPSLFIINAPKVGKPVFIKYNDICYSAPGPRTQQFTFTHVQLWNLLLVTSANGVEVGILGTKDSGENPSWTQYALLDEARIELPLSETKDETYPIGFALDTSTSHQFVIGEKRLPIMPMIHVLSTHGHLITFNFLNLIEGAANLCSPPPPCTDLSGQFKSLEETMIDNNTKPKNNIQVSTVTPAIGKGLDDLTFAIGSNVVTSTPALKEKSLPLFANNPSSDQINTTKANPGFNVGSIKSTSFFTPSTFPMYSPENVTCADTVGFVGHGNQTLAANNLTYEVKLPLNDTQFTQHSTKSNDAYKAVYTVPPTFTSPLPSQKQEKLLTTKPSAITVESGSIGTSIADEYVAKFICLQVEAFENELKEFRQQTLSMLTNEGAICATQLLGSQIIQAEVNIKVVTDLSRLTITTIADPANQRQLIKMRKDVEFNAVKLNQLQQLLEDQWSEHQDIVRRNSKHQMHIPYLDGIYQRMSSIKDLLSRQRSKLDHIKIKMREKGLYYKPPMSATTRDPVTMESLADSILSLSLSQTVQHAHARLSPEKLQAIRSFTEQLKYVQIIQPKRPDRKGLKSEVIMEYKLQTEHKQRELAKITAAKSANEFAVPSAVMKTSVSASSQLKPQIPSIPPVPPQSLVISQSILAKPQASKPTAINLNAFSVAPTAAIACNLNFSSSSSFVKTSNVITSTLSNNTTKALTNSTAFTGYGSGMTTGSCSSNHSKPEIKDASHLGASVTPVSFNAKVLQSNGSKSKVNMNTFTKPAFSTDIANTQNSKLLQPSMPLTNEKDSNNLGDLNETSASTFKGFTLSKSAATITVSPPAAGSATFSFDTFASSATSNTPFASPASTFSGSNSGFDATSVYAMAAANTVVSTATTTSKVAVPDPVPSNILSISGKTLETITTTSPDREKTSIDFIPSSTTPGSFSFANLNLANTSITISKPSSVPNVTLSSASAEPKTAATAPVITSPISSNYIAADSLLSSLTACKPSSKEKGGEVSESPNNVFSRFGNVAADSAQFSFAFASAGADGSKSFFSPGNNSGGAVSSGGISNFSFSATSTFAKSTTSTSITTTSQTAAATISTSSTPVVLGLVSTSPSTSISAAGSFTFVDTTPAGTGAASMFGALNLTSSTTSTSSASAVSHTASPASSVPNSNIFGGTGGGTQTLFGGPVSTVTTSTPTSSIFSAVSSAPPIFGGTSSAPTATGTNIFSGIPKPEQSIFGSNIASTTGAGSGAGLFAAATVASTLSTAAPGNIFSGSASVGVGDGGFASPTTAVGGSIFGGSSSSSPFASAPAVGTAASGSIFGGVGTVSKQAEGANIFGSSTQQAVSGGGSIFGKSTFGQTSTQSPTNIFGGGQSQTSASFGSSSIFGGSTNNAVSGGSLFSSSGNSATAFGSANATSPSFGAFGAAQPSVAFSSGFAQGGASVSQSGFGSSPPQQQQSAFAKPVFGGPATFGTPSAPFGGSPTFGGAPTFGSPKGFGSFSSTSATTAAFGNTPPAAPKGNIFDTLGSTEAGLSFGNLAQSTQQPAQSKPTFGGSSFMNYRS